MRRQLYRMGLTARLVFSNPRYAALGSAIFAAMLVGLLAASDYIFFEPYVVGHVPSGGELGFVLIVAVSALSALVVPAGIMSVQNARAARRGFAGGITGTSIGIAAGVCSCGPLGFALASSLGAAGVAATSFLTTYDTPIRLAAIAALLASLYASSSAVAGECKTA